MKRTILLGVNGDTIYTGEFEVKRLHEGEKVFTASFNIGIGFDVDNTDSWAEDYFEELWNNSDDERKLELLQDGEITKAEARDNFINDTYYYSGYRAFIDCSCTDFEVDIPNGDTINFETESWGQCDIREETDFENTIFTNKEAVMKLLELWDNFHLKEISKAQEQEINSILESMSSYEPYEDKFEDFIRNNIEY